MTTIAMLGSGIMASALTVPLADNGHDIRLVGTHLDREIISSVQLSGVHPGLQLKLPAAVRAFQLEDVEEAFDGAEVVLSGVNSFGVRWAGQHLARLLRPGQLVIAIAKGMEAAENGDLRTLPRGPGRGGSRRAAPASLVGGDRRSVDRGRGRRPPPHLRGIPR
jgi:glycerol-3-phosphate dehydrogenase (NAD(P)+)